MQAIAILILGLTLIATAAPAAASDPCFASAEVAGQGGPRIAFTQAGQPVDKVSSNAAQANQRAFERIRKAVGGADVAFLVCGNHAVNAFSTYASNGTPLIVVYTGLLNLAGDDEAAYATVIGHEYGHLVKGHIQERLARLQLASAASQVVEALGERKGHTGYGNVANLGFSYVRLSFSREDEREADAFGLDTMTSAGYDPNGAVRFWEKMVQVDRTSVGFLSDHPLSTERLDTVRMYAANWSRTHSSTALPSPVLAPQYTEAPSATRSPDPAWAHVVTSTAAILGGWDCLTDNGEGLYRVVFSSDGELTSDHPAKPEEATDVKRAARRVLSHYRWSGNQLSTDVYSVELSLQSQDLDHIPHLVEVDHYKPAGPGKIRANFEGAMTMITVEVQGDALTLHRNRLTVKGADTPIPENIKTSVCTRSPAQARK